MKKILIALLILCSFVSEGQTNFRHKVVTQKVSRPYIRQVFYFKGKKVFENTVSHFSVEQGTRYSTINGKDYESDKASFTAIIK